MTLTATLYMKGYTIVENNRIAFGKVINGMNFLQNFGASIRNIIGGGSSSCENGRLSARDMGAVEK